jgi:hypothetical protein
MNQEQVLSAFRWLATSCGGYVVSKGWVSNDTLQLGIGAILAIVPFAFSMAVHKK